MDIKCLVEDELKRRDLLSSVDENDIYIKHANTFRKLIEPHNGVLNSSSSIVEDFKKFVKDSGYEYDSEFSERLAYTLTTLYPELDEGLQIMIKGAGERKTKPCNLPQEGISAVDSGDFPNESTGGKAEEQSNLERAQKGQTDMSKERTVRPTGPQSAKQKTAIVQKMRDFKKGYNLLRTNVNGHMADAALVFSSTKTVKKPHRKMKLAVSNLRALLAELDVKYRVVDSHLRNLTSTKIVTSKEDEDKAVTDVNDAVDLLLQSVDEAKEIENALLTIKEMAEDALPEGEGKELADDVDEMFDEGIDEGIVEDMTDGDEPLEEEIDEEAGFDDELPVEDEVEMDAEMPKPPIDEVEPNKAASDEFQNLNLLVKGIKSVKHAYDSITKLVTGTSEYFPNEQRAYDTEVKDMPNEDTFNDVTLKSQDERARKDETNRKKEWADPGLIHEPGRIQDVRKINAYHVLGRTVADTAIVVTTNGQPVMKATFANVAGPNMKDFNNFKRFASKAYLNQVVSAIAEKGLDAVKKEMRGSTIASSKAKDIWRKRIVANKDTDMNKVVERMSKKAAVKGEDKINEKSYYAEAYGDTGYAADLTKDMKKASDKGDLEKKALMEENSRLKRKEILRVKANRAVSTVTKVSGLMDTPMTRTELSKMAEDIMSLDDKGFEVLSKVVDKIAERSEPSQSGVVHNLYTGVEDGMDGKTPVASDQSGLVSEIEGQAKNPEKVVTPPDVKASMRMRPSSTGVVPQMTRSASSQGLLDGLKDRFTTTENVMRRKGYDERDINEVRVRSSRRLS